MPTKRDVEKAHALIQAVRASLAKGYKHYKIDGTPLTTDLEIVMALSNDGEINVQPPAGAGVSAYEGLSIGRVLKSN